MNLKGGVIIIGSLIWEDHLDFEKKGANFIRKDWRTQNLLPERILTPVPIRYGKESTTRKKTYTMIFTKSCESNLGQGIILGFKETVNSFEDMERQAIALAIAEGIYNTDNPRLICTWGSVGLLINPTLQKTDLGKFEFISKKWKDIYLSYGKSFVSADYECDGESESPINQNGMLTLNWQVEMNDFDILLATPVKPSPKTLLTPQNIAEKINQKKYDTYFKSNLANNIKTYQDKSISALLPNN